MNGNESIDGIAHADFCLYGDTVRYINFSDYKIKAVWKQESGRYLIISCVRFIYFHDVDTSFA